MPADTASTVVIIDDHAGVRHSLRALMESDGMRVKDYATAESYLAEGLPDEGDFLIVDVNMPGMSGLELQEELIRRKISLPLVVVTGNADIKLAVRAMRTGALDFLEKPFDDTLLLTTIRRALADRRRTHCDIDERGNAVALIALLTDRERDVLERLILGESNKLAAHHLGISPRTVEIHRANLQEKLKAHCLSDLVRLTRLAGVLAGTT